MKEEIFNQLITDYKELESKITKLRDFLIYKVNISILKHFPFQSYSKNTPKAHKKSNLGTQKLVQLNK